MLGKLYLPIINLIYDRTNKISDGIRKKLLWIFVIIEVSSTYLYQCDEFLGFQYSASINALIGIICFAGIIIAGVDKAFDIENIKTWIVYLLMICGVAIFLSGFHHYIGYSYILMGFTLFLMMPFFLIVWCEGNKIEELLKIFAYILVCMFIAFFTINMIIAPPGNAEFQVMGRYFGMAADPNGLAKVAVIAYISSIYLSFISNGYKKIPFVLVAVISIVFTLITASRTNIIAMILISLAVGLFLLKKILNKKYFNKRQVIAILLIGAIVIGVVTIAVFAKSDASNVIKSRINQGVLADGSIDVNSLSSGRIELWKYCLSETTLVGNDISGGIVNLETGVDNDHAHNTVIELLYRSGLIAGISFLIVEIYSVIWAVRTLFNKRKNETYEIFAVLLIIAFAIASIFDIVVLPFAKMTTFLFYISLAVVISKEKI